MSAYRLAGVAAAAVGSLMLLVNFSSGFALLGAFALVAISVWYAEHSTSSRILTFDRGVVITGCDTGFGHELAHALDSMGMTVFAGCRDKASTGAQALRENCSQLLHVLQLDVTSDEQVAEAADYIKQHLPKAGLLGLINNAGLNHIGEAECTPMEQYENQLQINVLGMVRVTKACLPLIRKCQGRILNVSSVKGLVVLPYNAPYNLTKYAVECFSDCLRLEMRKWGVKVVIIEPGHYGGATESIQLERLTRDYNEMWEKSSKEVQEDYGKDYIVDGYIKMSHGGRAGSSYDISPIIKGMTEALLAIKPKHRYLIGGGNNRLFDPYVVLANMYPFVPSVLMDRIIMWYTGPAPVLPKALQPRD